MCPGPLSQDRPCVGRRRLRGSPGQLGEAATKARSGDRQAQRRRLGVRGATQTLGGGTHAELADALAAPGA